VAIAGILGNLWKLAKHIPELERKEWRLYYGARYTSVTAYGNL